MGEWKKSSLSPAKSPSRQKPEDIHHPAPDKKIVRPDEGLTPLHCPMGTLSLATGIGVINEERLPDLLQVVRQDMVDYPVPEIPRRP